MRVESDIEYAVLEVIGLDYEHARLMPATYRSMEEADEYRLWLYERKEMFRCEAMRWMRFGFDSNLKSNGCYIAWFQGEMGRGRGRPIRDATYHVVSRVIYPWRDVFADQYSDGMGPGWL